MKRPPSRPKKGRTWKGWMGFTDNDPCRWLTGTGGLQFDLFTTRAAARRQYADCRRVLITELPQKARQK
jgi:hypothetical protein